MILHKQGSKSNCCTIRWLVQSYPSPCLTHIQAYLVITQLIPAPSCSATLVLCPSVVVEVEGDEYLTVLLSPPLLLIPRKVEIPHCLSSPLPRGPRSQVQEYFLPVSYLTTPPGVVTLFLIGLQVSLAPGPWLSYPPS